MDPSIPWCPAEDPARRQEAQRYVITAKDHLLSGKSEHNMERCWQLVNKALSLDPCAPGGNAVLVAVTALRATDYAYALPSGDPNPYAVFGLDPAYPDYRDPAVVESYYRQAFDLLNPRGPCSPAAFADAARLVDDAWAFLSDPDCKAALDSAYEAFEAVPKRPIGQEAAKKAAPAAKRQKRPSSDDGDGNSKESAIDLDKETNANRIKVLELEQRLSSEKLETTKLAHLTAQEAKEEKRLILEAKKVEKESKMMDAYNNLISQDTSSMSDEEKAERVVAMKCIIKAFFPVTI